MTLSHYTTKNGTIFVGHEAKLCVDPSTVRCSLIVGPFQTSSIVQSIDWDEFENEPRITFFGKVEGLWIWWASQVQPA